MTGSSAPGSGGRPTLELRLDTAALPMGAQWIMVSGENSAGRGPPLRSKLVDIVRSRPVHANFSGMKKDHKDRKTYEDI